MRVGWCVLGLFSLTAVSEASWWRVFHEDFSTPPASRWTYAGVTNSSGDPLAQFDAANQRLIAEWDQGLHFDGSGDPWVISNSTFSAPLGRTLTDADTFRFGAKLRIAPGSIPDTLEFYQIANFGLYNLGPGAGADRAQSDNYSGNSSLVRDANNLMEFNYFINNRSFGFNPFIQGTAVARMPMDEADSTAYYITGSGFDPFFHNTDMGADTYLPEDRDLFVEVTYFGAATGAVHRRIYTAIYTNAARTDLLIVNGVPMYYWTRPAATNLAFDLDRFAFVNYAAVNFTVLFGGSTPDGAGAGAFDDAYVDVDLPEGALADVQRAGAQAVITWSAVSGRTYSVVSAPDPLTLAWSTTQVVVADGGFASATNPLTAPRAIWALSFEEQP